jgi:hypothetical protein
VLLGHVDEFVRAIPALFGRVEEVSANEYFQHVRFLTPAGRSVHLLGFAFSFWGDIAERLVAQIYAAGASEVIYLGKVGSLDRDLDLYRTLVIPDTFMLAEHDQILTPPFRVPNGLVAAGGTGGLHVTTPTVLEQSYLQREVLAALRPRTIDNEIGYMARAAAAHNAAGAATVHFASLSFATDYVRREVEHAIPAIFDLANNREAPSRALRHAALGSASRFLYQYLSSS